MEGHLIKEADVVQTSLLRREAARFGRIEWEKRLILWR
jgi:hypothetical protein